MSRRILLALVTISLMGPSGAAAQSAQPDVAVGALALRPLVGPGLSDTSATWRALPQQVGRNRTRGALWGGGIGLLAGGLLGGLTADADDQGDFGSSLTESAATGEAVLLGAVVGAGLGAILGATLFAPSHRSASGDGGGLSLSVDPTESSVAISGRIRIGR